MKIHWLGTAAYEGIPSLFCRCDLCRKARDYGGPDIRTRTSVLIDDELKIDFPPDSLLHMLRDGLDLETVKDLVFTHSHSDHLYAEDLAARLPGYAQSADHVMQLYGNDKVIDKITAALDAEGGNRGGKYALHRLRAFERTELKTAALVPLPASHDPAESCFVHYIEKDGKTVLYGHDSGWFPPDTWAWLKGKRIDIAILECTMGPIDYRKTHMNIDAVLETVGRMKDEGMLSADSRIVVTHFSHNAGLTHREFQAAFEPHGIEVAYDGMIRHY